MFKRVKKYQKGGVKKITPADIQPVSSDTYSNLNPKDFLIQEKLKEIALQNKLRDTGTLKQGTKTNNVKKVTNALLHPATALSRVINNQPLTENAGDENKLDLATSVLNPFFYTNAMVKTAKAIGDKQTYTDIPKTLGSVAMNLAGDHAPDDYNDAAFRTLGKIGDAAVAYTPMARTLNPIISDLSKAKNLRQVTGYMAGIPIEGTLPRLSQQELKVFRQIQEIQGMKDTGKSLAERMKLGLTNDIPDEHFQNLFSRSKSEAKELLDNGFGQPVKEEGSINLNRTRPRPEPTPYEDISSPVGFDFDAYENAMEAARDQHAQQYMGVSNADRPIVRNMEEYNASMRNINAPRPLQRFNRTYRNIPEGQDPHEYVRDLIQHVDNEQITDLSNFTDDHRNFLNEIYDIPHSGNTVSTPEPLSRWKQGVQNTYDNTSRQVRNVRDEIQKVNKIPNDIADKLKKYSYDPKYPLYEGYVQQNLGSLFKSSKGSNKAVADAISDASKYNVPKGEVVTGSLNTSHNSYLTQLKKQFNNDLGEQQFLGYKPMNDAGYLSDVVEKPKVADYLNTEIDELIRKGKVPNDIQRPFFRNGKISLPHYGTKVLQKGGNFSINGYKQDSPDRNNPYNIIPSGDITMKNVNHPVMGIDNLGFRKLMMPGQDYKFKGNQVFEIPIRQEGGEATIKNNRKYGEGMISNWWNGRDFSKGENEEIQKQYDYVNSWYKNRKQTFPTLAFGNYQPVFDKPLNVPPTSLSKFPDVVKGDLKDPRLFGTHNKNENRITLRDIDFNNPSHRTSYLHEYDHAYQDQMKQDDNVKFVYSPASTKNHTKGLYKEEEYAYKPEEVHSRIMQLRYLNNIDPKKRLGREDVKNLKYIKDVNLEGYDENNLLELMNELVSNNSQNNISQAQQGGLWDTNKKGFVDSVNNANLDKNFVQRFYGKQPSIQVEGYPNRSTHLMGWDGNLNVAPQVVQINGKLHYLPTEDARDEYAQKTGEFIQFKNPKQAKWYAENGYKMGTGVLKKQAGGLAVSSRVDTSYNPMVIDPSIHKPIDFSPKLKQPSEDQDFSYLPMFANSMAQAFATRVANRREESYQQNNLTNPLNYIPQTNNTNSYQRYGTPEYQEGGTVEDDFPQMDEEDLSYLFSDEKAPEEPEEQIEAPQTPEQEMQEPEFQVQADTDFPEHEIDDESPNDIQNYAQPSMDINKNFSSVLGNSIASIESEGNYKAENPYSSAVGKYQFLWNKWGDEIKKVTGVTSKEEFKNSPQSQEDFFNYYSNNHMKKAVSRLKAFNNKGLSDDQLGKLYHFKGEGGAQEYLTQGIDRTRKNNISIKKYLG